MYLGDVSERNEGRPDDRLVHLVGQSPHVTRFLLVIHQRHFKQLRMSITCENGSSEVNVSQITSPLMYFSVTECLQIFVGFDIKVLEDKEAIE